MSRGGRGGFGAARGGLKGATWDYDPTLKGDTKPSENFPPHPNLKRPAPLTERELKALTYTKNLRRTIRRGPLYTQSTKAEHPGKIFGEEQMAKQYGSKSAADYDPFRGVQTYSQKYERPKRTIPDLSGVKFNKDFFPPELHPTLDGKAATEVRTRIDARKSDHAYARDSDAILAKIDRLTAGEDADGATADGDEEQVEEEKDDDFQDDDEDMGGDYDGEQYFDNGENDDGDGDEGGDGDY